MCMCVCGGGGGGGYSDIFIHTLAWAFFRVQNFEFQNFWGFQKTEYLLRYEDFLDIFLGSSQNWTIKVQTGGYFLGCSNFKYLLGCFNCLIFFFFFFFFGGGGLKDRCWAWSISSNLSLLNAYKWAHVLVGFCCSGLLS